MTKTWRVMYYNNNDNNVRERERPTTIKQTNNKATSRILSKLPRFIVG